MTEDTRQELQALEELAAPYRFKTGLREDDQEPVIHGHGGVVEYAVDEAAGAPAQTATNK